MSNRHEQFVCTMAMLQLDGFVIVRHGRGRPGHDRASIARAFVAKAVFNVSTTRAILDRLHSDAFYAACADGRPWRKSRMRPCFPVLSPSSPKANFRKGSMPPWCNGPVGTLDRPHTARLHGHRSARETSA